MEQNHKSVQGETEQKIYSYIGLATKAGKAVSGEFSTEKAIKERKAKLVLISKEASDNTKKKFQNYLNASKNNQFHIINSLCNWSLFF